MAQRSGINRSLMWLRKVLQITEETESPRVLSEIVQPAIDLFGWERLAPDLIFENTSVPNTNRVVSSTVPVDTFRLVIAASVEHADAAATNTLWIDHELTGVTTALGVLTPFAAVGGSISIRVGLQRWIFMRGGERLSARSAPPTAVGINLTLRTAHLVIDAGEYVAPLGG